MKLNLKKWINKVNKAIQKPSYTPKSSYATTNSDSIEFENGLIIKYGGAQGLGGTSGNINAAGNRQRINFPTPFPNQCFFVITGVSGIGSTVNSYSSYVGAVDKDGFNAVINGIEHAQNSANTYWSTGIINYIAIGN